MRKYQRRGAALNKAYIVFPIAPAGRPELAAAAALFL